MNRKNANESDPLCLVCGGRSTHFCDGILGWPVVVISSDGPCTLLTITCAEAGTALPYTCDAPLCENCRESGKPLSGPGGSDVTQDDLCPVCFAYGGGWRGGNQRAQIHVEVADDLRMKRHAALRRIQMKRTAVSGGAPAKLLTSR